MNTGFFFKKGAPLGPRLSPELVLAAQGTLGVRLPIAYVQLLQIRNGGVPALRCFPTPVPTSWAMDHIEVSVMLGIGYPEGIDGKFGSAYLIAEWEYPEIGVVLFETPSGGHDTVMLDYRVVSLSLRDETA